MLVVKGERTFAEMSRYNGSYYRRGGRRSPRSRSDELPRAHEPKPESENFGARRGKVRGGRRPFRGGRHTRGTGRGRGGSTGANAEQSSRAGQGLSGERTSRDRGRGGIVRGRQRRRWPRNIGERSHSATLAAFNISELASLEPEVLAIEIDAQLKEFQEAIGDANNPMDVVVQILLKLVKLAGQRGDSEQQGTASKIIAEVLSERNEKFHFQLKIAVRRSSFDQARSFCELFQSMLTTFESLASECLPIDDLHERLTKDDTTNSTLLKIVEELCESRDAMRKPHTALEQAKSVDDEEERDNSKFRQIPILPEWEEIKEDNGIPKEVRPNQIDTPYKGWMEYYDIQFRLIREDFIAPLRRGVAAFLQGERGRKNRDVKTYSSAKIVSQVTTNDKGICFIVKFDVTGFRRVNYNWEQSKRLIFGSLLCFIPMSKSENEDSIIFATVTDRDSRKLSMGTLMVQFEGDILEAMTHCREGTEFEIVESNSYFGATSPILQSVQRAEVETMPFTKQLIEGECNFVPPPPYLKQKTVAVKYNLSCLHGPVKKRENKPPLMIDVLKKESWEAAKDSELDSSQLNAIQTALTQEIAVIQGPPGTGKTYIGLKIVEGLLENRPIWDPRRSSPILVMCYTNHALDQFLEGIIDTKCCGRKLEVIRVGGRCKNEKVDAKNLTKIRRMAPRRRHRDFSSEIGILKAELKECNPEIIWQNMKSHFNRITLLPLFILKHVAHPYHYYQLTQMAQCPEQSGKEVEVWLGLWQEIIEYVTEKRAGKQLPKNQVKNSGQEIKDDSSAKSPPVNQVEPEQEIKQELRVISLPIQCGSDSHHSSGKEPVQEPENEEQMIEIQGEASLAQDNRMDDDDIEGFKVAELIPEEPQWSFVHPNPSEQSTYESQNEEIDESKQSTDESENKETDEKGNDLEHKPKHVQISKWHRRKDAENTIRRNLFNKNLIMDEDEVEEVSSTDLTALSLKNRWRLYNYWEEQRYRYLQEENRKRALEYSEKCKEITELRQQEDRFILERADVVGMTTTGAAKHQHILHRIKPKIVIVEEAAEVLEAHIVSALSAGTQHLILIGDHKQLRPKPNEHVLATKYNLSISLFERLVMKQMSQATLEIQHRMRPEIAQLVCPHIYEKLLNHESVEKYPDIRGIEKNMFFVCHTEPESEDPNLLSYQNEFEAKYIVGLCSHLLNLGYSPTQITILTPYVGQLLLLRSKMPKKYFEGVCVTAIDNFQGEENDIILFSMVRSTNPHSNRTTIGFVKEDNRVCVSLSRAKQGFYAIGNFELIRHQTPLWESIISYVESRDCYGNALPLYCCNHPETKYSAKKESDFKANAPNGGCKKVCDIRLPCGHSCPQICHVKDREHDKFKCRKICERKCSYNHPCKSGHLCCKKCPPCREIVERVIPNCGHQQEMECWVEEPQCQTIVTKIMQTCGHDQNMPCSTSPLTVLCNSPCSKSCQNGHPCQKACYEYCGRCNVEVEKVIPKCNHKQMVPCFMQPELFECKAPCLKLCQNNLHPCPRLCSQSCGKCRVMVPKTLLTCGHTVNIRCFKEPDPAKCRGECEKQCPNGLHKIKKLCPENWPLCQEKVVRKLPKCSHSIEVPCFEDPSTIFCEKPCEKFCEFGHKCLKLCHENCAPCVVKIEKTLPCGHTQMIPCYQAHTQSFKCKKKCLKLLNCAQKGHICKSACHYPQLYGPCNEAVTILMPTCSHEQTVKCYESHNPKLYAITCQQSCEKKLECGHACQNKCGEACTRYCTEHVNIGLTCGHQENILCHRRSNREQLVINCKNIVSMKIECGHTIQTECYKQKYKSLLRKNCNQRCNKILKCGHLCQDTCGSVCTTECKRMVKKRRDCGHIIECECYAWTQGSGIPPCSAKCQKELPCGHPCTNKCGEQCSICHLKSKRCHPCGHSSKVPCNSKTKGNPCKKNCSFTLICGHRCSGKCGDCYSSRMHAICVFEIRLRRFCGHSLTLPCAGLSDSCDQETHDIPCTHKQDYSKCRERCSWACKHYRCRKRCEEECDRPPCNEPCDKKMSCRHICPGLCGERCTGVCAQCTPNKFMKQFHPKPKEGCLPRNQVLFELECGHIFTVKYLDEYFEMTEGDVQPKQCPKCHQIIGVGSRYGNAVRRAQADVQGVIGIQSDFGLAFVQDHLKYTHREFYNVQHILATIPNARSEKGFLTQCVNSSLALYSALQPHATSYSDISCTCEQINNLTLTLVNRATREPRLEEFHVGAAEFVPKKNYLPKPYLTLQLLTDFRSELYRLALYAQCLLSKHQNPPIFRTRLVSSHEYAVKNTEKYLDSLNPLQDRISEETYEHHFHQIIRIASNLSYLHVQTPQVPQVVKGTWKKCSVGHLYCTPPKCGAVVNYTCPDCI